MPPKFDDILSISAVAADISLSLDQLDDQILSLRNWATWAFLEHPEVREHPHPIATLLIRIAVVQGLHAAVKGELNSIYSIASSLAHQYPPEEEDD